MLRAPWHTINCFAFSLEGTRIVTGGFLDGGIAGDIALKVWDAASDDAVLAVRRHAHETVVWTVAFGPDGMRIVSGSADKTLKVWDGPIQVF